ncbi:MAG: hypothetical protein O9327_02045 [Polaromonas sp.]|nr:hypothetical protein [Polaromonas sp.]
MPSIHIRVADAMRVQGYLPSAPGKELTAAIKRRLVEIAVDPGVAPLSIEPIPRVSTSAYVWLNDAEAATVTRLGASLGMSTGEAATALLLRDFDTFTAERESARLLQAASLSSASAHSGEAPSPGGTDALSRALATRNSKERPEQRRIMAALRRLDDPNRTMPGVLFLEAGTGIGKTLAYLGYLVDAIHATPPRSAMVGPCYVAVPTFGLMSQVQRELEAFSADRPSVVTLLGASEWISQTALVEWCEEALFNLAVPVTAAGEANEAAEQQAGDLRRTRHRGGNGPSNDTADAGEDGAGVEQLVEALTAWMADATKEGGFAWAKARLTQSVPAFRYIDDVTLGHKLSHDDAGWRAYLGQFERCHTAQLVLLTHAMLAHLVKYRMSSQAAGTWEPGPVADAIAAWRARSDDAQETRFHEALNDAIYDADLQQGLDRLPPIGRLIVDEGHALEDAFASAFGHSLSLKVLVSDLRRLHADIPGVLTKGQIETLEESVRHLASAGLRRERDDVVPLGGTDNNVLDVMVGALAYALEIKSSAPKAKAAKVQAHRGYRNAKSLLSALKLVKKAADRGSSAACAYLHWSPVRDYPRITVGRMRLDREFDYLWTVVARRAALVSGTLYEQIPSLSCESIRKALAVRPSYVMPMEPIQAAWQYDRVRLCMISPLIALNGRLRYVRPSKKGDIPPEEYAGAYQAWVRDIASYLHQAMDTAAGGCLVLATAYGDAQALAERLPPLPQPWDLLVQKPGVSLFELRSEFLAKSAKGRRVMLIAVGGAWTGFDLWRDDLPDALTDLVLLKAPFGLSTDTVSRLRRRYSKTGHFEIASSALLLVRQACGRLVRSPDTPINRRLHWLDGRIHDSAMTGMMMPIRRFLERYSQRKIMVG